MERCKEERLGHVHECLAARHNWTRQSDVSRPVQTPRRWRPAASKRSDGSCTVLEWTTGTGDLRKKGTQRSLRVAADGKGPLRSEAGKACGMAQCVFSCCILWGGRQATLCANALSLCNGVTRGPGPQVAVCQWALLYCGRHQCCAGWANGQGGHLFKGTRPVFMPAHKEGPLQQSAARWQQGTVPCCSAPCCQISPAQRQAMPHTAAESAAPKGGASAPPTALERDPPGPEAVAEALLLAGYLLRQLVLPAGERASLQAAGTRMASTAAAAGTAQHGRGSRAPA